MKQIEFETVLDGGSLLSIPPDLAKQLPDHGRATVVVVIEEDNTAEDNTAEDDTAENAAVASQRPAAGFLDDLAWRQASYDAFLKDDSDADRSYDRYL